MTNKQMLAQEVQRLTLEQTPPDQSALHATLKECAEDLRVALRQAAKYPTDQMRILLALTALAMTRDALREATEIGIFADLENVLITVQPVGRDETAAICDICEDEAHQFGCPLGTLRKMTDAAFGGTEGSQA